MLQIFCWIFFSKHKQLIVHVKSYTTNRIASFTRRFLDVAAKIGSFFKLPLVVHKPPTELAISHTDESFHEAGITEAGDTWWSVTLQHWHGALDINCVCQPSFLLYPATGLDQRCYPYHVSTVLLCVLTRLWFLSRLLCAECPSSTSETLYCCKAGLKSNHVAQSHHGSACTKSKNKYSQ